MHDLFQLIQQFRIAEYDAAELPAIDFAVFPDDVLPKSFDHLVLDRRFTKDLMPDCVAVDQFAAEFFQATCDRRFPRPDGTDDADDPLAIHAAVLTSIGSRS